jgi:hypothetical protein
MRTDGHDVSRFAPRGAVPATDRHATGPIGALLRLVSWLGRWRGSQPAI